MSKEGRMGQVQKDVIAKIKSKKNARRKAKKRNNK